MTPFIVSLVFMVVVVGAIVAGLESERCQPGHFTRLLLRGRREPVHQGRRLAEWLEDLSIQELFQLQRADGLPHEPSDKYIRAAEAIRQIGPKAVPCLVALIRNPHRHWELRVERLFTGRQQFDHQLSCLHSNVDQAFEVLGEVAKDAIPQLAELLRTSAARAAAAALGGIGLAALPELTQALDHPDRHVRSGAAAAINRIGLAALPAASALLKCLHDEYPLVSFWSASALSKMGGHLDEAVRVLADLALVDDSVISPGALLELMRLGQEAKAAVPTLLKSLESSKSESHELAKAALKAIDPAAAASAGLQ